MDLKIEAVCYDLGIPKDDAQLYNFIHSKVIEYGGAQQFRENTVPEIDRLRSQTPQMMHDFLMGFLGFDQIMEGRTPPGFEDDEGLIREMRAILQQTPLEMDHVASFQHQLLQMLEDADSLESHIKVYEGQILPKWREYTEDEVVKALRKRYVEETEEKQTFMRTMEKLDPK